MITALPLRPDYQRPALDARYASAAQRAAIVLPTGGGKTVCFAHQALEHDGRTLIVLHTTELAHQALDKISKVAPGLKAAMFMGLRKDEHAADADVVVAGVQTLVRHLDAVGRFGQIIVDECHHAVAASYMTVLRHFGAWEPSGPRVTGYTATLGRSDSNSLGRVWSEVVFSRDIPWMIRRRYLINPFGRVVRVPDLDLTAVRGRADYREDELGAALADSLAPELVARAYLEHGAGRKAIGFAPDIASAAVFAKAFEREGIASGVIHGGMPMGDEEHPEPGTRRYVLRAHRRGDFPVLWNCMVLTEGYDDPEIGCVILARPTRNTGLYQQMVGRGLRVDPARPYEEQDCLLLAVVPEALQHDLCTIVDLSPKHLKPARDGQSLMELEDELDAGEGVAADPAEYYRGPVKVDEWDPLGRPTTRVWLKTRGGTYFVAAGKSLYVFVMEYPTPGQWSVCWASSGRWRFEVVNGLPAPATASKGRSVGMTAHRGLPLDQALVWAGDLAMELGSDLNTARKAPWRKKVASDAMVHKARGLGLKVQGEVRESGLWVQTERAGVLSDRIDQVIGTMILDRIVDKVRSKA